MTREQFYKKACKVYGFAATKTLLARCRYQRWRYLLLPYMILSAAVSRFAFRLREWAHDHYGSKAIKPGVVRPIAFYLPQFHRIPENDKWWGEGFTEWTNVRKAQPLFKGHYQPHVPHPDIGYYDLSNIDTMKKQAEIAKQYGIYGFCFYYYYFKDGKRLLEKPLDNWLKHPEINFPFCFCWANENWTRAWDGGEKEIIMPQDYDRANLLSLLKEMLPAFKDRRYIKVDGKPMLLVYRAELISDLKNVVREWRQITREAGLDGIYLVMVQNFSRKSPHEYGFDAATEFASVSIANMAICEGERMDVCDLEGVKGLVPARYCAVRAYHRWWKADRCYARYKCVCPGWDNTPRRGERANLILDSSPVKFGQFLDEAFSATLSDRRLRKNGFVFINAWNEWGEGAHLEPDEKFGYANLEQVRDAVKRFAQ